MFLRKIVPSHTPLPCACKIYAVPIHLIFHPVLLHLCPRCSWKNRAVMPAWNRWMENLSELRRNRAILRRWQNRPLLPAFLRWVELFVESRRHVMIMNKMALRWLKQNIAGAFLRWSANATEDVHTKIIFTKVLLRWTRHCVKVLPDSSLTFVMVAIVKIPVAFICKKDCAVLDCSSPAISSFPWRSHWNSCLLTLKDVCI